MKISKKDSIGYAEYAIQKRLVEKKLAETRVCETATSRLNAHLNNPSAGVSGDFIDAYLTISGCTGNETQPSSGFANTDTDLYCRRKNERLFRSAEDIWRNGVEKTI